jgi:hypothetical protein
MQSASAPSALPKSANSPTQQNKIHTSPTHTNPTFSAILQKTYASILSVSLCRLANVEEDGAARWIAKG